jgi:choline monooxygenase
VYVSDTKLPHLLAPACYFSEEAYRQERDSLMRRGWHLIGSVAELARPGDYLTCVIADTSIQVRNFDGQLRALSNVCAHRHATICSKPAGNSSAMRCQYHGWEYQGDGSTGKIPEPKNFIPFDRDRTRLPTYALEVVGQLVFVNISASPSELRVYLGEDFYCMLEERFSEEWTLALRWRPQYPVNWKIPTENSLEAYHVPAVHPRTFREDPGAERSQHVLLTNRTWFSTNLPFSPHTWLDATFQKLEAGFVRWLGYEASGRYEQHHVFPNLLFSFTDAISLCNCVLPTSCTTSTAVILQFGRLPSKNLASKSLVRSRAILAKLWSRITAVITKRVLIEDLAIFSAIQSGMQRSPHAGILGRCEERIHRFQAYVANASKSDGNEFND